MAEKKSNMDIYEAHRNPPKEALKPIGAGRLKGMTDINPMWRIKALTEQFGACGIGWYYDVNEQRVEDCGNEKVAVVNISLYVKDGGEWSKPIHGTGGSKLIAMEKAGAYVSDEAFKMATTDALSVACKQLGFAADIYWQTDRDKYTANDEVGEQKKTEPVKTDKQKNAEMVAGVNPLLIPNGTGMTKERMDFLHQEIERTGINNSVLLGFAKVQKYEDMSEATYIALMDKLAITKDKA